ncbi:MAG TPA: PAS domain S-box protein, partial [Thermomicrobiales bacterium]|nr:PAS domain S-box protein [Thermomicrobiales bacterium]
IAGVVTDVSGRKRLEEERIRLTYLETERINAELTQRTMETTIERLTDGFISTNPALEITLINEPAAMLMDRTRDELPGTNLLDAIAGFADQIGWKRMVDAAMAPLPSSVNIYDARSARFIDAHIYPGTGGVTIYLRDVTSLREAEFERQRSESRFRSLVQQASDMTVVLDRTGRVTYCSPAIERILGYQPQDLIDGLPPEFVHPADRNRLRRAFLQLLRHYGTGQPIEVRLLHRDGTIRWIEATPTNLLTDVSVRGIVVNCRDVTERRAAERNLWLSAEIASVIGASLDADTMINGLIRLLTTYLVDCAAVAIEDHDGTLQIFHLGWKEDPDLGVMDEAIIGPGLVALVRTNRLQGISAAERSVIDIDRMLATADPGPVAPLLEHLRAGHIHT